MLTVVTLTGFRQAEGQWFQGIYFGIRD